MDIDGSGKLEFPEVKKMIDDFTKGAEPDKRPTEEEIRDIFNSLDRDGSGSLELEELVPLVRNILKDMVNNLWYLNINSNCIKIVSYYSSTILNFKLFNFYNFYNFDFWFSINIFKTLIKNWVVILLF